MPVSTNDCKIFITEFLKVNNLVASMFTESDGRLEVDLSSIFVPENWKRTHKCRPGGSYRSMVADPKKHQDVYYVTEQSGREAAIDSADIAWEREFDCADFEGQVKYLVLEDKHGKLHMGAYTGD